MLCPVFRCSGSANSPHRQIWNPRLCLPQRQPCGRSPSLSSVPSHCTFHTLHLLRWNSQVYYLLLFKAMEPLPCIRVTTTLFCLSALWSSQVKSDQVSQPLSCISLVSSLPTLKTALQTCLQMHPFFVYFYEASSGQLDSPLTAVYPSPCQSCISSKGLWPMTLRSHHRTNSCFGQPLL